MHNGLKVFINAENLDKNQIGIKIYERQASKR